MSKLTTVVAVGLLAGAAVALVPRFRRRLPPALTRELPHVAASAGRLARDAAPLLLELGVFYLDRAQPLFGQWARAIVDLAGRDGRR